MHCKVWLDIRHRHTKESAQRQGLSLFYCSANRLSMFWKAHVLPFCRFFPCFFVYKKRTSNSHLVALRDLQLYTGFQAKCYRHKWEGLAIGRTTQCGSRKPALLSRQVLKGKPSHCSRSVEPLAKQKKRKRKKNTHTQQNYSPLSRPPKHTVFCPVGQTTEFIYSWVSLPLDK